MTRLRLRLSPSGVAEVSSALRAKASKVDAVAGQLAKMLAEYGVDVAKSNAPVGNPYWSRSPGELRDGIALARIGKSHYLVVSESGHAAFVEFGTGVIGAQHDYPGQLPRDWSYSSGDCIDDEGWWAWYTPANKRVWTRGQRPKGYMAATAEELKAVASSIVEEVLA